MARYDQSWCDDLKKTAGETSEVETEPLQVLFVVTDTEEGKVAFHLDLVQGIVAIATAGKLPRGHKADVTVTVKEDVLLDLWTGQRSRDEVFMRGDIKVEGAYQRWLDELVPLFESEQWRTIWTAAAE